MLIFDKSWGGVDQISVNKWKSTSSQRVNFKIEEEDDLLSGKSVQIVFLLGKMFFLILDNQILKGGGGVRNDHTSVKEVSESFHIFQKNAFY